MLAFGMVRPRIGAGAVADLMQNPAVKAALATRESQRGPDDRGSDPVLSRFPRHPSRKRCAARS